MIILKKLIVMLTAVLFLCSQTSGFAAENAEEVSAETTQQEENGTHYKTDAEQYTDIKGTEWEEAVDLVSEVGIMSGYSDKTFRADDIISRSEFVVVMTRLLSVVHNADTITLTSLYNDVSAEHWAAHEIQLMNDEGIISGFSDGSFRPEADVTYLQALKILVEALGYGDEAVLKGGWSIGYLITANALGLTEEISCENSANLSRGNAAKLLKNALYIPQKTGGILADKIGEKVYYVSLEGDDKNSGTLKNPWRTAHMAGKTAIAGSTVIFEDGLYEETKMMDIVNSGTEDAPITFKARNKHKATLQYGEEFVTKTCIHINKKNYINFRDMVVTKTKIAKETDPSPTADLLLKCDVSKGCQITGNIFDNIFEDLIKITQADGYLIEDNICRNSMHEGIDIFRSQNCIVRNNQVLDVGRCGLMMKGNSYNMQIYNNYFCNENKTQTSDSCSAMDVGGSSNNISPFTTAARTGFESYSLVVYNNVIVSKGNGLFYNGIYCLGARDPHIFNNIIIGSKWAVQIRETLGYLKGWEWNPPVYEPVIKNNVFVNADRGIYCWTKPINPDIDNNIYWNVDSHIDENGIVADPKFVDLYSDWHVEAGSPLINNGVEMPTKIKGYGGEYVEPFTIDYGGNARDKKWDIGIYNLD